jgi:hypothetical protein
MMVVQQFRDGTLLSRPARECFKNSFLNILLLTRCLPGAYPSQIAKSAKFKKCL